MATLVSFDRIFQADYEDGTLDTLVETSGDARSAGVWPKAVAHWIATCLPLIVLTPLLALMLNLPAGGFGPLIASLIIGTPALSLIGALAAALTVSLRRASILVTVLAAPLFTPVLHLWGRRGQGCGLLADPAFAPAILLLTASALVSLIVAPFAGAAAIRANLD